MRRPVHFTVYGLFNFVSSMGCGDGGFRYYRPKHDPWGYSRWRLAWWVLVGKADVITYPGVKEIL